MGGSQGSYRIKWDLPLRFLIPGIVDTRGPGFPWPLPAQPTLGVVVRGFSNSSDLNGDYMKWFHELGTINERPTYWKQDDFVMYWCPSPQQWQIHHLSDGH